LGIVLENTGRYNEAEQAYKIAMAADSGSVDPINNLASLLEDREEYPEAISLYKKAILLQPGRADSWNGLGIIYFSLKEYNEAETAYLEAIRLDSNLIYPWHNLGRLYDRTMRYREAIACYKKAVELRPGERGYWDNLLEMLDLAELSGEKLTCYKKMQMQFPGDQTLPSKIAFIYLAEKDYTNAELYFLQALKLYPDNIMLNYDMVSLYALWENKEKALHYLETAFKNGFDNFRLLETDPDLVNIRNTDAFKELVKKYRK